MPPVLSPTADQRVTYGDRSWGQFKLIQKGLGGCPGVRLFYFGVELLSRCVPMAETSRLEAAKAFRQGISAR